jgi:hypothetical protein
VDSRVRVGSELSTWGLADAGSVAHRWVPLKWVIARDLRVGSEGIFFFFVRLLFTLPVRILHLVSDGSFRMISPAARNTDLTE